MLARNFAADPAVWATSRLFCRGLAKIRSRICASLFGAPGLYVGPHSKIHGTRFIRFGRNFYAQGSLWLDAITQYRGHSFTPSIILGDDISLSDRVHITCIQQILIANQVLIGSGVLITDHSHGIYSGPSQSSPDIPPAERMLAGGGPVVIDQNVWIGDNAVILGPVNIGAGSIVGANSVVKQDVPPRTMVAGVPARPIKHFNPLTGTWDKI